LIKLKILHLTTFLQGGAGKVVVDLAKNYKSKGMSVIVGFTNKSVKGYCNYPSHLESLKKASISQIKLPSTFDRNPAKITESAKYLLERFKVHPPDIIHCHAASPSRIALEFRKLANLRIPVIQTMHGWGIYKTPKQEKEDIETLNKLEHVVSISDTSDSLLKAKGLNNFHSSVIYNGIEDRSPQEGKIADNNLLEITKLQKQGFFIAGVVGTVDKNKNQRLVLETIKTLPKDLKIIFFFIGEGEIEKMLALANSYKIGKQVSFLGYKKNSKSFIDQFDLLICSSKSEGGPPIVLMEAFSSSTLVLASNTPEHKEAIIEGVTGFTFKSDDISDLKDKIINIYQMEDSERITSTAYKFFKDNFSSDKSFFEYETIYKKLTNKESVR
jgi:glycosyltransferase involved in cell wall biosynthesis